jgi:two-component sensor histidine kinase
VLTREVDHRVKNSLQMVASLLRIQAGMAGSDEVADALDYAQERIAAVSRLHEALHASADIERIELDAFLDRIAAHLRDALPPGVALDLALAPHITDARVASSCGMVVNELVGNAVKHAFPEGADGRIRVVGEETPAGYLLSVEDDGVGFAPDTAGQGLGLTLVRAAAHRLQTDLDQPAVARGTRWTLLLPPSGDAPAPPV